MSLPSPSVRHPAAPISAAALAWSSAGLVLLLAACALPFVHVAKFGQGNEGRMLSGSISLWEQGQPALAALVLFCGLLAPLALLAAILLAPRWPGALAFVARLAPWAMPDVRLLAILVAFTKLSALVEAFPSVGLWCYAGAAVCSLLALRCLPRAATEPEPRCPSDWRTAAALGLAAAALLVPAYLLPVMSFEKIGQAHADTLFASVGKLWHAGLWGIALVVFTASIVVPVLKLGGLAVLVAGARRPQPGPRRGLERLHALVHGVGRWSMLDVFLVAFLCGVVDFGELAQIEARPGVLAFAGAVVLTMFATAAFDVRLLAPASASSSRPSLP